jgi:hypothetical protein
MDRKCTERLKQAEVNTCPNMQMGRLTDRKLSREEAENRSYTNRKCTERLIHEYRRLAPV